MNRIGALLGKLTSLYGSSIVFKVLIWVVGLTGVAMTATVTVQAFVLRRYKRTIYRLRASTIQLRTERDVAKEKLIQERAQHKIDLLKKNEIDQAAVRNKLTGKITESKKRQAILDKKLKDKIKRIDDYEIDALLKNSKKLEEQLGK